MKPPALGICLSGPWSVVENGRETALPYRDIEIAGNRGGLLRLAELIRQVAGSNIDGYHTHIFPDDGERLLRTEEFSLTISLNSIK
jgi:hypothetical protein